MTIHRESFLVCSLQLFLYWSIVQMKMDLSDLILMWCYKQVVYHVRHGFHSLQQQHIQSNEDMHFAA